MNFLAFLRSVVTDGVTIGHPCCGEHDCTIPLVSVKDRFCPEHQHLNFVCSVTTCFDPIEPGFLTCSLPEHRKVQSYNEFRYKAMFQLKDRLTNLKISQPIDSIPSSANVKEGITEYDDVDSSLVDTGNGICNGKSEQGNQTVKARLGRKRTHNEELCVASCGVILGRATFYGSEAPNGVRVSNSLFLLCSTLSL